MMMPIDLIENFMRQNVMMLRFESVLWPHYEKKNNSNIVSWMLYHSCGEYDGKCLDP